MISDLLTVKQAKYQIWVELKTRKIGNDIDWENDALIDVFNSWYEGFKNIRETIRNIDVIGEELGSSTPKSGNAKTTASEISALVGLMNSNIRPILTKWSARFRQWYDLREPGERETEHYENLITPQELQRKYPHYYQMMSEMDAAILALKSKRLVLWNEINPQHPAEPETPTPTPTDETPADATPADATPADATPADATPADAN